MTTKAISVSSTSRRPALAAEAAPRPSWAQPELEGEHHHGVLLPPERASMPDAIRCILLSLSRPGLVCTGPNGPRRRGLPAPCCPPPKRPDRERAKLQRRASAGRAGPGGALQGVDLGLWVLIGGGDAGIAKQKSYGETVSQPLRHRCCAMLIRTRVPGRRSWPRRRGSGGCRRNGRFMTADMEGR